MSELRNTIEKTNRLFVSCLFYIYERVHGVEWKSNLDLDEEKIRVMVQRLKSEGLFLEWPEAPRCRWVVSDEIGNLYCAHPKNSPVYFRRLGRRAGMCCVGSCPVGALFPHQEF